jgi:hypothetical protein
VRTASPPPSPLPPPPQLIQFAAAVINLRCVSHAALQKHVNVLIQAQLDYNPQLDLQAAQRICRRGQQHDTVYIYRILMDTLADKQVLGSQVYRAGGWLQRRLNPRAVHHTLCIPESPEVAPGPNDMAE